MNRNTTGPWRIGELAAAAGVSVRALRHYEQLGLLGPALRSEHGQRLYVHRDVQRLYRVCALRDLGLSLAEIARVVGDESASLHDLLNDHLRHVDAELERLGRLSALIAHALEQARHGAAPDVLSTIEAMTQVARHAAARTAGATAPADARVRWAELGDRLRAFCDASLDPGAPQVIELAREIRQRLVDFAEGDARTLQALAHLRQHAPPRSFEGWDATLFDYMDRAIARLEEEGGQ